MSFKTKLLGVAIATAVASSVHAEGQFYVGAGAGVSHVEPETNSTGAIVTDNSSSAKKLFMGYDATSLLSVEGYYTDLGQAELSNTASGETQMGYTDYGVDALLYAYNPAGRQALTDREGVSLYGKVGFGKMDNDPNALKDDQWSRLKDTHVSLGAGAEYGMENGLAVRGQYDSYDKDSKATTVSLLKRFGGEAAPVMDPVVPVVAPQPAPVYDVEVAVIGDSDNDGVTDDIDACPNSAPGAKVDQDGCLFGGMLPAVNFETDSARLTKKAKYILNGVIQELQKYPDIVVEVQAHTDNQSSDSYNQDLSNRRAASVVDYLSQGGVERRRMRPVGYGESRPAFRNDTEEGRYRNRRVEFEILNF